MSQLPRAAAAGLVAGLLGAALAATAQQASPPPPLRLRAAVRIALRHSPRLRAAQAAVQQARAAVGEVAAGRRPRVETSEGFARSDNPVSVFGTLLSQQRFTAADLALNQLNHPAPLNNYATRAAVDMPLFDARQSELRTREARLGAAVAASGSEQARQAVVAAVVNAYYRLAAEEATVRVASSAAAEAAASLHQARARFRAGMAVEADALSAQVYAAQAEEALAAAQGQAAVARAGLNRAMGRDQATPVTLPADAGSQPGPAAATLADLLNAARRLRPELKAEQDRLMRARAEVTRARAAFLPTLDGAAAVEHDQWQFARGGGSNWTLGLTLQWTPYNGGRRHAALRAALAAQRQELARGEELRQGVELEVREAWEAGITAARQAQIARQATAQAAAALTIMRNRYRSGLATMTELLAAETALARAQNQALEAGYALAVSAANRALAAGELTAWPGAALPGGRP
jgi:outer membrane protein